MCRDTWYFLSPVILPLLENFVEPDIICRKVGFCLLYPQCTLYPHWPKVEKVKEVLGSGGGAHINKAPYIVKGLFQEEGLKSFSKIVFGREDAWKVVWPWDAVADHLPFTDVDGDKYSPIDTLRGANWRGKDCNDIDHTIYPGRAIQASPYIDRQEKSLLTHFYFFFKSVYVVESDCNGIYGGLILEIHSSWIKV